MQRRWWRRVLLVFFRGCLQIVALPASLLDLMGCWKPLCKRLYPCARERLVKANNQKLRPEKQRLFRNVADFAGPSGQVHLLEIGAGSGTNFPFYPAGSRVTCTDPNPNFREYLLSSVAKNPQLHFEGFVVAAGEDLRPVPDASVDVVVATQVLCSVADTAAVLREVLRILRPGRRETAKMKGGAFYFMEHVAADQSSWNYFWQQVCTPTWKYVADGCSLEKETEKDLENANFSELNLQHINTPLSCRLMCPQILGYAVK